MNQAAETYHWRRYEKALSFWGNRIWPFDTIDGIFKSYGISLDNREEVIISGLIGLRFILYFLGYFNLNDKWL